MGDLPKLLTVADAAERLGVHPETIRRAVRSRKLAHYRFAGCIRIAQDHLNSYLATSLRPALEHIAAAGENRSKETSPVAEFQRSRRFNQALARGLKY